MIIRVFVENKILFWLVYNSVRKYKNKHEYWLITFSGPVHVSRLFNEWFSTVDILLLSANPSDFDVCSCGVAAVESLDDAAELLATEVRLGSCQSKV